MNRVERPRLRGTWIGALLGALNPVVRALLASPLHWPLSRWFALLSWTGAKTGRQRSTPVSYVRDGTVAWVTTGDRWTAHAVGNGTLRVRVRGTWHAATATLIDDPEASRAEHLRLFAEHGWFRRLAGIPARDGGPDETAVERAVASGRRLVRLELRQLG